MPRREFSKAVQVEIIKRASADGGRSVPYCEECVLPVRGRFEIHHLDQDALQIDKKRKLTAADGQLLCRPCHSEITKAQAPVLAKAKRREAKHLGVRSNKPKIPARPKPVKERKPAFVPRTETSMKSEIYRRFFGGR